jgi:hypothetical protein
VSLPPYSTSSDEQERSGPPEASVHDYGDRAQHQIEYGEVARAARPEFSARAGVAALAAPVARPARVAVAAPASRIETFGNPLLPAYYIMTYAIIGLAIMWPMEETNTRRLDE